MPLCFKFSGLFDLGCVRSLRRELVLKLLRPNLLEITVFKQTRLIAMLQPSVFELGFEKRVFQKYQKSKTIGERQGASEVARHRCGRCSRRIVG